MLPHNPFFLHHRFFKKISALSNHSVNLGNVTVTIFIVFKPFLKLKTQEDQVS